jgi:hypothetical protein
LERLKGKLKRGGELDDANECLFTVDKNKLRYSCGEGDSWTTLWSDGEKKLKEWD